MGTMKRIAGPLAVVLLLAFATLSACSGGGSGARVAPTSKTGANSGSAMNAVKRTAMVQVSFTVPAGFKRSVMGPSKTRQLLFTSSVVKGAVAVQRCNNSEIWNSGGPGDGTTTCANGTIFTLSYDVTNLSVCPGYAPNTTFTCTLNFPAGNSSGSQFEVDLYDTAPGGGTNGVGGVISNPVDSDGSCLNGTPGPCILGAGLSNPDLAVPLTTNNKQIVISQIQGFVAIVETSANNPLGVFIASKDGTAAGTHITGSAVSLGFDAQNEQITGGACVQDAANEYANALTPAADEAPSPAPNPDSESTTNVGGVLYHRDNAGQIPPATGFGPRNAAHFQVFETGTAPSLTTFAYTPCLIGYTGPNPIMLTSGQFGHINFPGDTVDFQYSGVRAAATPSPTEVGSNGDAISEGIGFTIPYFARAAAAVRDYYAYEQNNPTSQPPYFGNHELEGSSDCGLAPGCVGAVTLILDPLWGELANPSTPPWCPSPTCTTPTGSFTNTPPVWTNQQGPLLANMQGTNSTIQVNALQAYLPTGGAYSASVPGSCAGIVAVQSGPTGPLFTPGGGPGGGAAWTMVSGLTSGTCVVTYTDSFNSFSVTFTNTGRPNPASPGPGTPAPTLSPFGGPTAPGTPTV